MAGLGYKVWSAGDVLAAADVNGYLMEQGVMVFASSGARGSAIGTAVSEGMMSYLKDTNSVEYYSGSTWVPVATSVGGFTANRAMTSNGSGDLAVSTVTTTELGYLSGVTSAIQTQINSAGGLALITSQSFTSSSAVQVNDVFSSTYQNYKVFITWRASGNNTMRMRFRTSGSDYTGAQYFQIGWSYSGTVNEGDATSSPIGYSDVTGTGAAEITFYRPNESGNDTAFTTHYTGPKSGAWVYGPLIAGGGLRTNRADTGFTIYPDSGNVTGTVRVYGIKNS
jgi:hypothetical protein